MSRAVTDHDKQFGVRIRTMRAQRGLSQEAVAKKLGLTFQQIQKYEKGTNRLSLARAVQLAGILGTTVTEMIGADGTVVANTKFDLATFKLAQAWQRLHALSPQLASDYRKSIDTVCDVLEARGGKKKRGR